MPSHDFIEVRIIVDGSPLIEYPAPGDGDEPDRTLTRYVEVRPDQNFGVQITLQPGFDFQRAGYVCYEYQMDNFPYYQFYAFSKRKASNRGGVLLSKMKRLGHGTPLKDDVSGVWKHYPYMFGALGMSKCFPVLSFAGMSCTKP